MRKPYRPYSAVLLLFGSLLFLSAPTWSAFPTTGYFPLPDGAHWNYVDDDSFPYSAWIVSGVVNISGALTKEVADSEGDSLYFTNDENGIRLHRLGVPIGSSTATFKPPIPMAKATANVGDKLISSGITDLLVPGQGTFPLNYTSTATIVAEERIVVPAGTFDTIRLTLTYRLFGSIQGYSFDETATSTLWLAPNIGIVKDYEAGLGTLRLVDTNVASKLPSVSIDFPTAGEILTRNFDIEFAISNWIVTPSGNHFRWYLDGIDQGPRYDLSPIPVSGLADGQHVIILRLVNADGSFTDTEDSVSFIFEKRLGVIVPIINTILLPD